MSLYRVTKRYSPDGPAVTYETDERPVLDAPFVVVELLVAVSAEAIEAALKVQE